jgi:broad specificity phosphatase PhoE
MRDAARGLAEISAPAPPSSPLVRARQTAEILMETFEIDELHLSDALATGMTGSSRRSGGAGGLARVRGRS